MRHSYRPSATERFKIVSSKSGRFAAIEGTTEQLAGGCTLYRIKRAFVRRATRSQPAGKAQIITAKGQ